MEFKDHSDHSPQDPTFLTRLQTGDASPDSRWGPPVQGEASHRVGEDGRGDCLQPRTPTRGLAHLRPCLCPSPNSSISCTKVQSQDASAPASRCGRELAVTPSGHSDAGALLWVCCLLC